MCETIKITSQLRLHQYERADMILSKISGAMEITWGERDAAMKSILKQSNIRKDGSCNFFQHCFFFFFFFFSANLANNQSLQQKRVGVCVCWGGGEKKKKN